MTTVGRKMRVSLPSLRALEAFEAVGHCGGVTGAARELGVSPGAVSQQIKNLEQALGRELVVHKAGGLALTETGERYLHDIVVCLDGLRRACCDIQNARSNYLIVSALPLLVSRWLAPAILEWRRRHPSVGIRLDSSLDEPHASGRAYDFRITYANRRQQRDRFVVLFTDELIPVYGPELLLGRRAIQFPSELLRFRLLNIDWSPYFAVPPNWQAWFRAAGIKGNVVTDTVVFSHSSLAIEAALKGYGVALAQSALIANDLQTGLLVAPFKQTLKLPSAYVLAWNDATFHKEGAREMHRWIIGLAKRLHAP